MTFPELLRESWKVYKHRSQTIILTAAIVYLIAAAIIACYSYLLIAPHLPTDPSQKINLLKEYATISSATKYGSILVFIGSFWIPYGCISAAVASIVSDYQTNNRPTGFSIVGTLLQFLPLAIPLYLIFGILICAAGVFMLIGGLFVTPFISYFAPVFVYERKYLSSIVRGLRVAARNYWMTVGSWFLQLICNLAVGILLFFIPLPSDTGMSGRSMQIALLVGFVLIGQIAAFHGCLMTTSYINDRNQHPPNPI